MRAWWLAILVLLAACEPPVVPGSAEACRVERLATVPLRKVAQHWVADVGINGKPAVMMLDTGATGTHLFRPAVERLNPHISDMRYSITSGSGGSTNVRAVVIEAFTLGGLVTQALTVPELVGTQFDGKGYDGILGMDVLGRYDIDVDLPNAALSLYRQRFCPMGAAPFPGPSTTLRRNDLGLSRSNRPVVEARLNGRPIRSLLDTGATFTSIDDAKATAAGGTTPTDGGAATGRASTAVAASVEFRRLKFTDLNVGGSTYRNPTLWTANLGNTADAIIGLDILNRRRMWYSLASDTIYLGPDIPPPAAPQPAPPAPAKR